MTVGRPSYWSPQPDDLQAAHTGGLFFEPPKICFWSPTEWRVITRLRCDCPVHGSPLLRRGCSNSFSEVFTMFTGGAVLLTVLILWYGSHCNEKDRSEYDRRPDDNWILALHTRQDIKAIVFMLG